MEQNNMHKSLAAVIAASALAASGCHMRSEERNAGPEVSRNYQVGAFQGIEVAGPYDVEVKTGGQPGVSARGGENLLGKTVVEVKDGKLVIHPEKERGTRFSWGKHGKATFTVTVPQLSEATIAGSGDMRIDKIQGQSFKGTVAGSGALDVGSLDVQTLEMTIAGSGEVRGSGKAQSADYSIAGSGDVELGGVQTQQAKVSIAGSGSVRAHSSGTADVSIMGSGDVDISGGAKCKVSKMGAGDVRCS
jgi:hypothetical protein